MSTEKEQTVLVAVGGRHIEMRKPTEGAILVLARVSKSMPESPADPAQVSDAFRARVTRNLAAVAKIIDEMIVSDADRDWVEDSLIGGDLPPEQLLQGLVDCAKAFRDLEAPTPKAGPPAAVRRRRQ